MDAVPFFKYHGLGNDFVVVEAHRWPEAARWVASLCDRHRGVGADGLLVVELSDEPQLDGRMVVYNRDGTRPEMCGNGVRCVVRHLVEECGLSGELVVVGSDAGPRRCRLVDRGDDPWRVAVEMGCPAVEKASRPVRIAGFEARPTEVDVGNPHAVFFEKPDVETIDRIGRALNDDPDRFADGVNVEFVEQRGDQRLEVVVYERGVGRTMACGTGACAAAAAAIDAGHCSAKRPVAVVLPGGELTIERRDGQIWMIGPVERVYDGALSRGWLGARQPQKGAEESDDVR